MVMPLLLCFMFAMAYATVAPWEYDEWPFWAVGLPVMGGLGATLKAIGV